MVLVTVLLMSVWKHDDDDDIEKWWLYFNAYYAIMHSFMAVLNLSSLHHI